MSLVFSPATPSPHPRSFSPPLPTAIMSVMHQPVVGRPVPRKEGRDKVTGRARYVDDLHSPACSTARPCAAPPRAAASAASASTPAFPGTNSPIVTAKDIPGENDVALIHDQPYLAATSSTIPKSRSCCSRIPTNTWSKKPAAASTSTSSRSRQSSPSKIRSRKGDRWGDDNIFKTFLVEKGDVDAVWAAAALIVEGEYSHRRAGAALHRDQRHDRRRQSRRRRHGLGLAAVPVLRPQGAAEALRACRRKRSASSRRRPAAASAARKNIRR